MVMKRYRAGLATSLELVEADDTLQRAQVTAVVEELNVALQHLGLLRAAGVDPEGNEL
jgi:outer membrane protein TolC